MKNAWRHDPIYFGPVARPGGGWRCFKDSPSPPAAPDYSAAAQAQGAANVDTARVQGRINNPNVITPYGTQTVSWGNGAQAPQQQQQQPAPTQQQATGGYNLAGWPDVQSYMQANDGQAPAGYTPGSTGGGAAPQTNQAAPAANYSGYGDQPTITQTLSPAQQQLLDSQNRISQNLSGVAETGLNRVSQGMAQPFDTSGLPAQASNVQGGNYTGNVPFQQQQGSYNQGGNIQSSTGYGQPIQSSFDAGSGARSSTGYNQGVQGQVTNAGSQQTGFGAGGPIQGGVGSGGNVQSGLNFSGAPGLPGTNDFSADRDAVTGALMSRINPQFDRQEQLTRTNLMNQGIASGSEASNYDLDTLNRARNDAQQQAVLAGGQEQSRLFGLASAARGQYTGEQAQQGQFANAAQSQLYNQGLASGNFSNTAQAQQFGQNLQAGQFANTAQQNQFGQNLQAGQFANTAQQQGYGQSQQDLQAYNAAQAQNYAQNQGSAGFANAAQAQGYTQAQGNTSLNNAAQQQANQQNLAAAQFGNQAGQTNFNMGQQNAALGNQVGQQQFTQGLANANLTNQARQQGIQEQAYMRQLPLNELNALRTGAQVQNPQFQPYQGATVGQTPVFGAAQAQQQANTGLYNAQQGAANSFNSGLMSTAAAVAPYAIAAFSDRRLKSNIVRIGTHPLGIGWYEYDIFGQRVQGVMADEAPPHAVHTGPGGWLMVDYGALHA